MEFTYYFLKTKKNEYLFIFVGLYLNIIAEYKHSVLLNILLNTNTVYCVIQQTVASICKYIADQNKVM